MPKAIKFKNDTFLDSSGVNYNRKTLKNVLDLRGSCAVLEKTNNQNIPATSSTIVQFNNIRVNDNNIIQLNANGSFTILEDISRILVTLNMRSNGTGQIFYMNGANGGFNSANPTGSDFNNGAGVIEVVKGGTYQLTTYFYSAGLIVGYDRNWCGLNIVVLK